jgi:hypothetical protein
MKKEVIVICICILSAISFLSGCTNVPKGLTQFSIVSFDVEPDIINQGESANLSWIIENASSVNIDNGIGSVALTGYKIIQPTQTTTYTLTASNATLTKNATIKITITNESNESTQWEKNFLTITVGTESYNYSLNNLTALPNITGQGSYINKNGILTGPNNYTGVDINVLLGSCPILPDNFDTLQAIASDGYSRNYSIDEVNGHVVVYNETGEEIGTETLTMIIAYKENGLMLNNTTKGPLRIAFIGTPSAITNSGIWLGSLIKIELI